MAFGYWLVDWSATAVAVAVTLAMHSRLVSSYLMLRDLKKCRMSFSAATAKVACHAPLLTFHYHAYRNHRGLRHYWGLRVKGQHTKTTGRRGKTVGVAKKR